MAYQKSNLNISVVIPTYKRPKALQKCAEQIIIQLGKYDELIICNDDRDKPVMLPSHIVNNQQVRIIDNIGNRGPGATRNFGVLNAKNNYVLFVDDDDLLRNGYIMSIKQTLRKHPDAEYGGCAISFSHARYQDNRQDFLLSEIAGHVTKASELLFGAGCGMWFKKSSFIKIGMFNENLINSEDNDLCARAAATGLICHKFEEIWMYVNGANSGEEPHITNTTTSKEKVNCWWLVYKLNWHRLPFHNGVRVILLERFIRRSIRDDFAVVCCTKIMMNPRDLLILPAFFYILLLLIKYKILRK